MSHTASPKDFRSQPPQDCETQASHSRVGPFELIWAFARAADSREAGMWGEDFLAFVVNESTLVFSLCDGVGESFMPRLAARFVGEKLLNWLVDAPQELLSKPETDFNNELSDYLRGLVTEATVMIQNFQLTVSVPAIREALEGKRLEGSEAMFVCGRLELPSGTYPNGRVHLAWAGDMRLWIWRNHSQVDIGNRLDKWERWSTHNGLLGLERVNVWVGPLDSTEGAINRLLVYSDGLTLLDLERNNQLETDRLQSKIDYCATLPDSDDISILDVNILTEAVAVLDERADEDLIQKPNEFDTLQRKISGARHHTWLIPALLLLLSLVILIGLIRILSKQNEDLPVLPTIAPTAPPIVNPPVTTPKSQGTQEDLITGPVQNTPERIKEKPKGTTIASLTTPADNLNAFLSRIRIKRGKGTR
jgi:hypothetical protein